MASNGGMNDEWQIENYLKGKYRLLLVGFLVGLLFDPADGGRSFFRNVSVLLDYTPVASTLRSHHHQHLRYNITAVLS
jgi:hypothetical protein